MEQTSDRKGYFAELIVKVKMKVEKRKKQQKKKEQSKKKMPSKSKPAPKQGHHIINKGVINIYEDIMKQFARDHRHISNDISVDDLKAKVMNNEDDEAKKALDFVKVETPLSKDLKEFIRDTTVPEKNETGGDKNAEQFGLAKLILIKCTVYLMHDTYDSLLKEKKKNEILLIFKDRCWQLQSVIKEYFKFSSGYAFVDEHAYEEWKKTQKTKPTKIEDCIKKVWEMIEDIAKCKKKELGKTIDVTPLVFKWAEGAFWVYRVLQQDGSEVTSGT